MKFIPRFIISLALTLVAASSCLSIEIAGELFVDLDAASFTTDDLSWTNNGSYEDFAAVGAPMSGFVETTPVVWLNGTRDAFEGDASAPAGLVGSAPTATIEAWVFNPFIDSEETIIAWGDRGGPDGSNMSFNYGTNSDFGAVGHWGDSYDLGWSGTPEANLWHHLAYTFDGETSRVYLDGELNNEKRMPGLDTFAGSAIAVGAQWRSGGRSLESSRRGSMAIGRIRVHDEALSGVQVAANFNQESALFVNPRPPAPLPLSAPPVHRYDFNNPAGNANETSVADLEGDADGEVLGEGATYTGTQLRLEGGTSEDAASYVDLPDGIISRLTDATIEGWITIENAQNTPRIFSFGSSEVGELDEIPVGESDDEDVFSLSAARGSNISRQNISLKNRDPDFGGNNEGEIGLEETLNTTIQTSLDEEFHFAIVYDSDGGEAGTPVIQHYRNGDLVTVFDVTIALENLNDINNLLGRSNNTTENNFGGLFNEFRIYDYALSRNELLGNIESGPNTVNLGDGLTGDYNGNGLLDAADLDLQAEQLGSNNPAFDLTNDGTVDYDDRLAWVKDLAGTWIGDSNLDGEFNSGDLVQVFTAGRFETGQSATWEQGDWDGNGLFDSGDFVAAFTDGGYEVGQQVNAIPEPTGWLLIFCALPLFVRCLREGTMCSRCTHELELETTA